MTTHNNPITEPNQPAASVAQASLFDDGEDFLFEFFEEADFDPADFLDYEEVPLLLVDTDPERAVARQKQMMDYCFGGIGEERKEEKRMGLAMQQLDIEQRHALRLLLIYQDPTHLATHLQRCLDDPAYGYGERGDQGRTIAQAMAALRAEARVERDETLGTKAQDESLAMGNDLAGIAAAWLESHRDFQQRVLNGTPLSFRSLFDYSDIDTFVPLLQRVGDMTWRLGVEGEGQYRDFQGPVEKIWPDIGDTYVQWCEKDNEAWLADLKRKATRLPDTILRAARADRLRKQTDRVEVKGNRVTLATTHEGEDWPRLVTMADEAGVGQLGLSRLSGHAFYELAWEGGLHVRRFEISGTTRNKVPFEHIEVALTLAEALAADYGLQPEPVTPGEVEAAYLRRMKLKRAEFGPPDLTEWPEAIKGQAAAAYKAGNMVATMFVGGEDFAYITGPAESDQTILLRRNAQRGVMMALPVRRGRPRPGSPLLTTSLAELEASAAWNRALCAWGTWLAWVSNKG